jgi:hypothetical protein
VQLSVQGREKVRKANLYVWIEKSCVRLGMIAMIKNAALLT